MSKEAKDKSLAERIKDVWEESDNEPEEDYLSDLQNLTSSYESYIFEDTLDKGGVKEISQMRDQKTGRVIAMAKLKPEFHKPEHINRFLREARTLASLEHPNIVPLHDIGYYENDLPYFTMKLLKGGTLASQIKSENKNNASGSEQLYKHLRTFNKVCDAVAYAHSKSTVHLDLKPENIQISEFGEVLVLDWGFAKNLESTNQIDDFTGTDSSLHSPMLKEITRVGSVNGTPGYMSPEQVTGKKEDIKQSSDIYSLGAILFSLITLERPYSSDPINVILEKTGEGIKPPISDEVRKVTPKALIAICEKAMALKPEDRYNSVVELQNDINAFIDGFATRAENPDLFRLFILLCLRNQKLIFTASIFFCTVVFLSYFYISKIEETETKGKIEKETAIKKQKEETIDDILNSTLDKEEKLRYDFKYNEALELIQSLRRKKYDHPEIWFREGILLLGDLNFESAYLRLDKVKQYPKEKIIKYDRHLYIFDQLKKSGAKSGQDIIEFAHQNFHLGDSLDMQIQTHLLWSINNDKNKTIEDKLESVRQSLLYFNNHINPEDLNMHYSSDGEYQKLDLSKNPSLDYFVPIIGLPINELDISGANLVSLSKLLPFLNNRIKKINISSTGINFHTHYLYHTNFETIIARNIHFTSYNFYKSNRLKHLDLEDSSVYLRDLNQPPKNLEYLNVAGTRTKRLRGLGKATKLKTLVVDQHFIIDPPQRQLLDERGVEIIIKSK